MEEEERHGVGRRTELMFVWWVQLAEYTQLASAYPALGFVGAVAGGDSAFSSAGTSAIVLFLSSLDAVSASTAASSFGIGTSVDGGGSSVGASNAGASSAWPVSSITR